MIKEFYGRIKVDKKIKPLRISERKAPNLVVGENYYVSFGSNDAYPCKLLEIDNKNSIPAVTISIELKSLSRELDINGQKIRNKNIHVLDTNEIGDTPESAVLNEVHL